MKSMLKTSREQKGMKLREVAHALGVDQALVSKFESGARKPTRTQVSKLAEVLNIDADKLMVAWLKEKILYELGDDKLALQAIVAAEQELKKSYSPKASGLTKKINSLLKEIDKVKSSLQKLLQYDSYRIAQALELEYTFESNRIEGNTLTLKETDLVINEGLTISGKSMREHLEAINHQEAIAYIKHLVEKKSVFNEHALLAVHNLILRGIDQSNAGKYRQAQVMIKGSKHVPPAPYLVPKQMEDYFIWYRQQQNKLHPVVLAAEMHERLVTIHPFIDGNGRTSRLVMNLILLKHGYVIANLKGDAKSRMNYYLALEQAQKQQSKLDFTELIAQTELDALNRYIKIIGK